MPEPLLPALCAIAADLERHAATLRRHGLMDTAYILDMARLDIDRRIHDPRGAPPPGSSRD